MALWLWAPPSLLLADYTADLGVTYNGHGEVESMTYPDGEIVDYTFTRGGLQESSALSTMGSVLAVEELDAAGAVLSAIYAGGEELHLRYDDLGRPTQHELHRGSDALYQMRNIRYDAWGYVRSAERRDRLFPVATDLGYHYTSQGQLAAFEMGGQTATYDYDSTGNLIARSGVAFGVLTLAPASASYDESNRVAGWSYDAAGRVIEDDQYRYTYNDAGRLALVEDADNGDVVAHYFYDAGGLRVRTLEDDRVIYHRRDSSGAVLYEEERSPGGDVLVQRDFVLHNGQPVLKATADAEGRVSGEYTFTDRLGNPAVRWDESGQIKLQEYAPYGEQMFAATNHVGAHGFTGHEDDPTGRIYMRARHYDPMLGRFNRPDPARDFDPAIPSSYNLYQYGRSNPVNMIDPDGRAVIGWVVKVLKKRKVKIRPIHSNKPAAMHLKQGENMVFRSKSRVKAAAKAATGKKPVMDGPHVNKKTGTTEGRDPHAHLNGRPEGAGHAFWKSGRLLTGAPLTLEYWAEGNGANVEKAAAVVDLVNPLSLLKDANDLADLIFEEILNALPYSDLGLKSGNPN